MGTDKCRTHFFVFKRAISLNRQGKMLVLLACGAHFETDVLDLPYLTALRSQPDRPLATFTDDYKPPEPIKEVYAKRQALWHPCGAKAVIYMERGCILDDIETGREMEMINREKQEEVLKALLKYCTEECGYDPNNPEDNRNESCRNCKLKFVIDEIDRLKWHFR